MIQDTVATIFLVNHSDVKTPWKVTLEANEHTYGGRRRVLREFNMYHVIGIEDKRLNFVNAVFEGGLKTFQSRNEFRGYQDKFEEYDESASKTVQNQSRGPEGDKSANTDVDQFWSETQGMIQMVNTDMKYFLRIFGLE